MTLLMSVCCVAVLVPATKGVAEIRELHSVLARIVDVAVLLQLPRHHGSKRLGVGAVDSSHHILLVMDFTVGEILKDSLGLALEFLLDLFVVLFVGLTWIDGSAVNFLPSAWPFEVKESHKCKERSRLANCKGCGDDEEEAL